MTDKKHYAIVIPIDEETPVTWVGVHPIRWGQASQPTHGFISVEFEDAALLNATPLLLKACELASTILPDGSQSKRIVDEAIAIAKG